MCQDRQSAKANLEQDDSARNDRWDEHSALMPTVPPCKEAGVIYQDADDCGAIAVILLDRRMKVIERGKVAVAQRPAATSHPRMRYPYRATKHDQQICGDERQRRYSPENRGTGVRTLRSGWSCHSELLPASVPSSPR